MLYFTQAWNTFTESKIPDVFDYNITSFNTMLVSNPIKNLDALQSFTGCIPLSYYFESFIGAVLSSQLAIRNSGAVIDLYFGTFAILITWHNNT